MPTPSYILDFMGLRDQLAQDMPSTPRTPIVQLDAVTSAPGVPAARTSGGDWRSSLSPAESWIIQRESNFNPTAKNPKSSAFGIWQGLSSTRGNYAKRFGFDPNTVDPTQQLQMFRAYVQDRYGTAENAQKFWQQHHWY